MFKNFNWALFVAELLQNAGPVIVAVEKDKADASHETKTELATQSLLQTSTVAQSVDPKDTEKIQAITAIAGGIIQATKTPSPIAPASTS
jgi:hypothetical protein